MANSVILLGGGSRIQMSSELSNKLANLGFVCACLVVIIHVPVSVLSAIIKNSLSIVAVPVFFMMSGFLLGRHFGDEGWYARAVTRRIRTLLIPFFLLNLMWLPWKFGIHYVAVRWFGADDSARCMDVTLYNIVKGAGFLPWGGNVVPGLWYVRTLFYLVIISPVIALFTEHKYLLFMMSFLLVFVWSLQYKLFQDGVMVLEFSARCPLFFMIGAALARYVPMWIHGTSVRTRILVLLSAICLQSLYYMIVQHNPRISPFLYTPLMFATILATSLSLWVFIPCVVWPKMLTQNAFPLFVIHGILLYLVPIPIKFFARGVYEQLFCGIPAFVLIVVLSIGLAELLRKMCPRMATLMFGGR